MLIISIELNYLRNLSSKWSLLTKTMGVKISLLKLICNQNCCFYHQDDSCLYIKLEYNYVHVYPVT